MAQPSKPEKSKAEAEQVDPDWQKKLYTAERVKKLARGEMTLQEFEGINGPEMMRILLIGYAMYEQGRWGDAKVIFEGLTALDPNEGYYRTLLGAIHLEQDEVDKALVVLDEALRLNPKDNHAYVNRGEARLKKGMIVEAGEDFQKALQLDPENRDAISAKARVLAVSALETLQRRGLIEDALPELPQDDGPGAKGKKLAAKGRK
jgi:tetratricopeptide (TPR) repeat protein